MVKYLSVVPPQSDSHDVGGGRHRAEALAAFQGDGETRLVYARHRADPDDLFYLVDGTARQIRDWAREHLECLMPECDDRRLKVVARTTRRDGFAHYVGSGGHSREGLAHQQAKALIARWVAERWPDVTAVPERSTRSGARRADVMLTWPDGRQVAVEVQYAAMSPEDWRVRHQSYRDQGVVDVWLLGHLPPHLRRSSARSGEGEDAIGGRVGLGPLHQAMVAAGVPVLWINPVEERLGTVWVREQPQSYSDTLGRSIEWGDGHDGTEHTVPPSADHERAWFEADPLRDCDLTPDGITSPVLGRLTEARAALDAVNGRRKAADAERRRMLDQRAAEQAKRDARRNADRAGFERWLAAKTAQRQAQWERSELYAKVVARYGEVPQIFRAALEGQSGVYAAPAHWRAVLYGDLILGRPKGSRFTIADCYRSLRAAGIEVHPHSATKRAAAVLGWLEYLARIGYVRIHLAEGSAWQVRNVEVLADIERLKAEDDARRERERKRHENHVRLTELRTRVNARVAAAAPSTAPVPVPPEMGPRPQRAREQVLRCSTCGLVLDPCLARLGHHVGGC
ncbi:competence protein CoiA family protein [Oryzihumus leptocrescens]|nr:competence protein CoiA family protein [Oryzihumus leptocrescens]